MEKKISLDSAEVNSTHVGKPNFELQVSTNSMFSDPR